MNIIDSPFLTKELRSRLRDEKTFVWITCFLILTILSIIITIYLSESNNHTITKDFSQLSITIFYIITGALYLFSAIISIIFSATAFTMERKQETLDVLKLTTMSSMDMVIGKIFSSMVLPIYMVILFIPIVCISFLFGGISPLQFILIFIIIITSTFFYCTLGMYASTVVKSTTGSLFIAFTLSYNYIYTLPTAIKIYSGSISFENVLCSMGTLLPFIVVIVEFTFMPKLLKAKWYGKLLYGIFYYFIVFAIIYLFYDLISFLSKDIGSTLNPVTSTMMILNDPSIPSTFSYWQAALIYFLYISVLSFIYLKTAVIRLDLIRHGIDPKTN